MLDRLNKDGLVEIDHEEVVQSRLRRYYRISGADRQWLGLILMPLLIFAVGFLLLRRKEARDELIALGRAHQESVRMDG